MSPAKKQKPAAGSSDAADSGASADAVPFDQRLGRLEAVVRELEGGGLGLEESIERYQEGIALLKGCHGTLQGFRARVEELGAEAEGVLTPFEGDPDVGDEGGGA